MQFFILLPYLTTLFCCIFLLDECFALRSTLYFFYFYFVLMFLLWDSWAPWRTQKSNNFSAIFRSLSYLTSFICYIYLFDECECFTLRSTIFCCISVLDRCFALRFMNTMKNTKKISTICLPVRCTSHNYEHCQEHQKGNNYFSSLRFFFRLPYLTTYFFVVFLYLMNVLLSYAWTPWRTPKRYNFFLLCNFFLLPYLTTFFRSSSLLDGYVSASLWFFLFYHI